jgi:capsular exopolysaccharide synthesis family protein
VRAKNDFQQELEILLAAKTKYTTEAMQTAIPFVPMIIHERAEPASSPGKPNLRLNLVLGVAVGLVFSLFLAFFIEYLDTSVKSLEDVENALEVPVLGVIPKGISVLSSQSSDTPDAEAYRIIRTNIEFNRRSADDNAITLISGGAGEGKSTTLFNLAYTFAQGGYNVLVVDADLRRPAQHHFFNVDNTVGLTDYLTSDLSLEDVIVRTSLDNLSFMPSGHLPKDAVGILNSQRMSDMIAELKQHFDLVFFDSPPILGVSDASVLSSEVDLTVMVVQHRRFPKSMLQRVKNSVLNVGGTLLGVVLNNVDIKNDKSYDYYTAYYDYYYSKKRGGKERQPKLKNNNKELTQTSMSDNEDQY